jgi:hypothetical protein
MIEKDLEDALDGHAAGGAHFGVAPDDAAKPYIVITQVGGAAIEFIEGAADQDQPRIQIDVFAKKYTEAVVIQSAIRATVCTAPFHGSPVGSPVSTYGAAVKTHCRSCDYTFIAPA